MIYLVGLIGIVGLVGLLGCRAKRATPTPDRTVTVFSPDWEPLGPMGEDVLSLRHGDGRVELEVHGQSRFIALFMDCHRQTVPVVVRDAVGCAAPYYVHTFDYNYDHGIWWGKAHLRPIGPVNGINMEDSR